MRTHRTLVSALAALLLFAAAPYAQTTSTVEVHPRPADTNSPGALLIIDGKLAEVGSIELAQRGQQVMVWLRDLEKLGWGTVQPGDSSEKTLFKTKALTLTFIKNQGVALVNSLAVQLPIDIYLKDGKLMVPLSFVAKSLGYSFELTNRPVALILTQPPPAPPQNNAIRGQVIYNGKPVAGIKVALVDPEYNTIKGFQATTDPSGNYAFDSVPDGKYLTYVWVGYNPGYFNRVSEEFELSGGATVNLAPISLGKIVRPIRPKVDEVIQPQAGKIIFEWSPCEGAQTYSLAITKLGAKEQLVSLQTAKPRVEVVTKKLAPGVVYVADIEARDPDGRFLGGTIGSGGKMWTFSIGNREQGIGNRR